MTELNTLELFRTTSFASIDKRAAQRDTLASVKNISASYVAVMNNSKKHLANDAIATLLLASNVDATRYESVQLNAIKKENYILDYLFGRNTSLAEYIAEIFASAYVQQTCDANAVFTKQDAFNILDVDHKKSEIEATFYQTSRKRIDIKTIAAQHKTTLDALVSLNILHYSSTLAHKHAYRVNFASDLTKRFAEKLAIVVAKNDAE